MKRLFIVEHRAHEYANHLLSDISVYAYAEEIGGSVINLSALEQNPLLHWAHTLFAWTLDKYTRGKKSMWAVGGPKFLPPTDSLHPTHEHQNSLYFFGWLFRNPVGLERYREKILAAFIPRKSIQRKVDVILGSVPSNRTRIGVHLRLKPFKGFDDGEFLVPPERVQQIIEEYLRERNLQKKDVALAVTCDTPLNSDVFTDYMHVVTHESPEVNLYLLSRCSVVIGTNTTLSNTAAWFGNIPHIVTTNSPIDWEYYRDKKIYFENKYADFLQRN